MENRSFKIGEVARRTGLTAKTIRYYEAIKLLPKPSRTLVPHGSGYRLYSEADLRRLAFVKQARLLDLSLTEIRDLMAVTEEGCCSSLNPKLGLLVERKLGEIDRSIAELTVLRRSLRRLQAQFRESLVKPRSQQKALVVLHVPCRDDTCENAV